jgi:hypothetical protein
MTCRHSAALSILEYPVKIKGMGVTEWIFMDFQGRRSGKMALRRDPQGYT